MHTQGYVQVHILRSLYKGVILPKNQYQAQEIYFLITK